MKGGVEVNTRESRNGVFIIENKHAYKKEKQRNHQHEVIASVSALTFFGIIALVITLVM